MENTDGINDNVAESIDSTEVNTPEVSQEVSNDVSIEENSELIAGKFKTQDDLISAYKALESKLGGGDNLKEEVVSEDAAEVESKAEDAAELVPGVSNDELTGYESEWLETGSLSEESYKSLAEKGYPQDMVDSYIRGNVAKADDLFNEVGGKDAYVAMTDWARGSFSEADIEAYNKVTSTGTEAEIKRAMIGLKAQYENAVGKKPNLVSGAPSSRPSDVFESDEQQIAAMSDRRYWAQNAEYDPAYARKVQEKMARSAKYLK